MKIIYFTLFLFLFLVSIVNAGGTCSSTNTSGTCDTGYTCKSGVCTQDSNTNNSSGGTVSLTDPLSGVTPQALIGKIIKGVLGLVGSLALAMFVYGGFTWMLAAGNSTNVEKGKQILIWATIGLIVIFLSYALVQFVFKDVLGL